MVLGLREGRKGAEGLERAPVRAVATIAEARKRALHPIGIDELAPTGPGRDRNLMRPVKLTAKNALFAGHDEGAHAWGRIASLIATCKLNGVEPYAWLKGTLEKIAAGHPQSRVHELLPWAYSATSN